MEDDRCRAPIAPSERIAGPVLNLGDATPARVYLEAGAGS